MNRRPESARVGGLLTPRAAALLSTAVLLAACSTSQQSAAPSAPESSAQPTDVAASSGNLAVTLKASEGQVPYDGSSRWAMTYNASTTGPTIRVHPGDHLEITLENDLNEPTNLHTHGLHVSPEQDNPFIMVEPGTSHTYSYDIPQDQQAGTYWYHPHMHELSAEQVASGLSGAIVVEDRTDQELAKVSSDDVLVINDPPLAPSNPWQDSGSAQSAGPDMGGMDMGGMDMNGSGHGSGTDMMTGMTGRTGPRLLTNGQDGVDLAGPSGQLRRAHVVNATASTRLRLTYSGAQMMQLATPGGRIPHAQAVTSIDLSPGERTEVVLVPGADGGQLRAQRMSNEGAGRASGGETTIASVPADAGSDVSALPTSLQANTRDLFAPDVKIAKRRVVTLEGHMRPTIDGQPFNPDVVNFRAKKGTVEEWVIKSNSPMVHPIHLHTWPFQVQGEQGWQDIVTVPAYGQKVIRVAFDDFAGKTVVHCHILDHEDNGMMSVIEVR